MLETKYPKVSSAPNSVSPKFKSSFICGANEPTKNPGNATIVIAAAAALVGRQNGRRVELLLLATLRTYLSMGDPAKS